MFLQVYKTYTFSDPPPFKMCTCHLFFKIQNCYENDIHSAKILKVYMPQTLGSVCLDTHENVNILRCPSHGYESNI